MHRRGPEALAFLAPMLSMRSQPTGKTSSISLSRSSKPTRLHMHRPSLATLLADMYFKAMRRGACARSQHGQLKPGC
jgi:hypothetical protein